MYLYSPIAAALVTLVLTRFLISSKVANKVQDLPNERSLHSIPVVRIGGVGLMAGVLSGWAFILPSLAWWVVLPLLILFLVSMLDDLRGLSVRYRLFVHIVGAWLLVLGCGLAEQSIPLGIMAMLLTIWSINLYNFMDGSDGLAGGMALIGFGIYGIAAMLANDISFAMANFSISAAALSFLYFNFYPARIFMGDAGSIPLGFLVAAFGIWGWQGGMWPAWFPFLVFSPFVLDATVTLFRRGFRREKIWQAHREHYYQRMVQMGMGHRNTAIIEYIVMGCAGISALLALVYPETTTVVLAVWGVVFGVSMLMLDYFWKIRKSV
jgi:UDP-N-acetylmuramyl pentapeptide phosphotransferase/UDP-N-acetylglucosamine-1-phosphate transferase